jgi:hypothetical protein
MEALSLHLKKPDVLLKAIIAVATFAVARQAVTSDLTQTYADVRTDWAPILSLAAPYF